MCPTDVRSLFRVLLVEYINFSISDGGAVTYCQLSICPKDIARDLLMDFYLSRCSPFRLLFNRFSLARFSLGTSLPSFFF